jgi:hypothetical protein
MSDSRRKILPVSLDSSPVIEAFKKDVDRTLLVENLKLTISERVDKMISALRFAEAVRDSKLKESCAGLALLL